MTFSQCVLHRRLSYFNHGYAKNNNTIKQYLHAQQSRYACCNDHYYWGPLLFDSRRRHKMANSRSGRIADYFFKKLIWYGFPWREYPSNGRAHFKAH